MDQVQSGHKAYGLALSQDFRWAGVGAETITSLLQTVEGFQICAKIDLCHSTFQNHGKEGRLSSPALCFLGEEKPQGNL
jgi:hypothetical protein